MCHELVNVNEYFTEKKKKIVFRELRRRSKGKGNGDGLRSGRSRTDLIQLIEN